MSETVEDLLVDEHEWAIRYIVVDTRYWLPGKKVLVADDGLGVPGDHDDGDARPCRGIGDHAAHLRAIRRMIPASQDGDRRAVEELESAFGEEGGKPWIGSSRSTRRKLSMLRAIPGTTRL